MLLDKRMGPGWDMAEKDMRKRNEHDEYSLGNRNVIHGEIEYFL